ncbi:hypothetical protein KY290_014118 [Solanum tuberosum]|uniref:GAG-pre-integrase domain-containing protein n=1 Tax=Solanum tuberosum TaxID=4113 RepID=A0ABQ7VNR0_SOLTU|nr:hypothetical protein KY289_014201 [Solanum tuberosum]KAH0717502.1 hypothetical protein KY285_013533 [Solanum tuberosum]KAH0770137.1 hypothetical protein KY290_014118 [Solanum tuberosum]
MAIEDDENVFNTIFSLMAKSDDEEDQNEITLLDLKDDLYSLPIKNLRKLAAILIDSVDELTSKNLMLREKLSMCENENSILNAKMSELSIRIGILKTDSLEPSEGPGTSVGGKRNLSILEEELEEKLKILESKLVASLETNSQLRKDLSKVKKELSHSLKWTDSSKILSNLSNQSFNGKKGLGHRPIEPPCNPHSKYVSISDNLLCTHCGRNGFLKEKCESLRKAKERHVKFVRSENDGKKGHKGPGPRYRFIKNILPPWTGRGSSQCWYIYSGCSRHMTGNTLNFLSLEAHQGGGKSFGSGTKGFILGIDKIRRTANHSIDSVHYVDGLKFNLLSVFQINDKGNKVKFMSEGCVVTNCATKKIVMSAKQVKNVYVADLDSIEGDSLSCLSAQTNDANLWHRRLGHVSTSLLNKLVAGDLVRGLPKLKFSNYKVYDACAKGK